MTRFSRGAALAPLGELVPACSMDGSQNKAYSCSASLYANYLRTLLQRCIICYFCLNFSGQLWSWLFVLWNIRNLYFATFLAVYFWYICGPGWKSAETPSWTPYGKRWSVWRLMADYFPARLVKTADLDPMKHYMFVMHPHGICVFSGWLNFATDATGFSGLFPGISVYCVTLASNFRAIGCRENCLLHGLRSASKRSINNILTSDRPGTSVLLAVGGAAESLLASPGTYDLVLAKRKGFVRVALETGACMVPVLCFGENDVYNTYIPKPGSLLYRFNKWTKRVMGVTVPVFWGTGLLGGWGLLPLKRPLTTVIGAPVPVPVYSGSRDADEFHRLVDQYHDRYTHELKKLWDQNKDLYAHQRRKSLCVVD